MDPLTIGCGGCLDSFPRTRGDGPAIHTVASTAARFPPHARGWTVGCQTAHGDPAVSPARAGMDLLRRAATARVSRFPRTRGDGPPVGAEDWYLSKFPPHARGWTRRVDQQRRHQGVSPARAGMDPDQVTVSKTKAGFPRTRGDGPR